MVQHLFNFVKRILFDNYIEILKFTNMNLVALKTFLAVVQTGNLNKAADLINVTQSTVTARLDVLESELGQALLVRSRKGAQLTKAGFAFQRHAEVMVRTWEQGCKAVGLPSGFSGMVSLACHPELWAGLGDRWIDLAQATQEETAFEAWPGEHSEIARWLNSGLVDVAITLLPVSGDGIASRELNRDRLVQVSSEPRSVMEWDENYIYVDLGADFRRQHSLAWPTDNTARTAFGSSSWAPVDCISFAMCRSFPGRFITTAAMQACRSIHGCPTLTRHCDQMPAGNRPKGLMVCCFGIIPGPAAGWAGCSTGLSFVV